MTYMVITQNRERERWKTNSLRLMIKASTALRNRENSVPSTVRSTEIFAPVSRFSFWRTVVKLFSVHIRGQIWMPPRRASVPSLKATARVFSTGYRVITTNRTMMMVLNTVKTLSLVVDLIFLAVAVFAIIKAPLFKTAALRRTAWRSGWRRQ